MMLVFSKDLQAYDRVELSNSSELLIVTSKMSCSAMGQFNSEKSASVEARTLRKQLSKAMF